MNAFNKLLTSVSQAFEFNQATLSGCVDIIVVKQRDGSLKSTPFHVRFGKLKVLKSKDKVVRIHVNNKEATFRMKLGEAGEGFFEEEVFKIVDKDLSSANSSKNSPNLMEVEDYKLKNPFQEFRTEKTMSVESLDGSLKSYEQSLLRSESYMEIEQNETPLLMGIQERSKSQSYQFSSGISQIGQKMNSSAKLEYINNENIKKIKFRTLRPSSKLLQSLDLKIGCNTISYTVQTSLQGSQTVCGHIYYWPADANVIISDIDGTITKTDFLGHLMPMVGKDWSQPGIAPLYSSIRRNGYHILYLTSRPIGQAHQTKEFLHSIYQDGKMLPHGPLVMSPERMVPSMKREVLFRRPELFKMACLKDIRSLFPDDYNPFHAGFGNRETDAIAYNSVGIPLEKVFLVNPKGDIHHHNDHPMKSYALINSMVKEMFPDILLDPKEKLIQSLGEANALQIDGRNIEESVAKVVS